MNQELLLIADKYFGEQINERHLERGGVYKLIAAQDGKRIPINRFLGTDKEGVLYIGKATSFIDRVINLKKSISPNYKGESHICGRRYKLYDNISKKFPFECLHVELIETDMPEAVEREMLRTYAETYGEVPPLNAI